MFLVNHILIDVHVADPTDLGVVTMWKFVECFLTFGEKNLVNNIKKMFESK